MRRITVTETVITDYIIEDEMTDEEFKKFEKSFNQKRERLKKHSNFINIFETLEEVLAKVKPEANIFCESEAGVIDKIEFTNDATEAI